MGGEADRRDDGGGGSGGGGRKGMSGSQGRPQSCPAAATVPHSRGGLQPHGGRAAAARTVAGVSLTRPRTRRRRRGVQGAPRYTRRLPRSPCPPTLHSHRRRVAGPASRRTRAHGRGEWGQSCGARGGEERGRGRSAAAAVDSSVAPPQPPPSGGETPAQMVMARVAAGGWWGYVGLGEGDKKETRGGETQGGLPAPQRG